MSASLGAHSLSSAVTQSSILKPAVQSTPEHGQEIEVYNLLIISQNTFEGLFFSTLCVWLSIRIES